MIWLLLEKVWAAINKYDLLKKGETVIAGVSGGPDSLVMLHLLCRLQERLGISVHVAHLDHCFRGKEAEEEAEWVRNTSLEWGLACTVKKVDVPARAKEKGLSAQDAGHLARREFFLELLEEKKADKIALAHHADDQAETVLIHFLSGAGGEGLGGILPINGPFIRPLLFVRREEIEQYCHEHELEPRRDPSNMKNVYLRNKIRNQLIPWLEENVNPNLAETLNRTAQIFWAEEENMKEQEKEAAAKCLSCTQHRARVLLPEWSQLSVALQRRIVRRAYAHVAQNRGLPYLHVEEVRQLAEEKQVGKVLCLPGKIIVEKEYQAIAIYPAFDDKGKKPVIIKKRVLNIPGDTYIDETNQFIRASLTHQVPQLTENTVFLPWGEPDKILYARARQEGDRFKPPGRNKAKKLKEFLIDKKVPRRERDGLLMIADENEVLWIPEFANSSRLNKENGNGPYLVLQCLR